MLLFKYTKGYIKKLRLQSQSLAESFELSQSNRIAAALRPMIILYIGCGVACVPTGILCFILSFFENTPFLKKLYFMGIRVNYFNFSCYILLSLITALYKFGIVVNRVIPETPVMKISEEQENHFNYLTDSWKVGV
ncbi:unnamed protein product [Bursaphelenchus okinawaensis]|uniref:Uncharacterized protein n=1 Tax=Bursaphelenchus okinawaensis TaxID=465554 RepID=A0A811KSP3_9BILA|nr:unnamed protein product [Bursaphelenchus okinawaensis]CAG9111191.1 unnamed protein product [Bursaphelenchus okinawaensis]